MPDWLLYWVFPWALINRNQQQVKEAGLESASDDSLSVELQQLKEMSLSNFMALTLAAGNNVFVSDETIDFVFNNKCCTPAYSRVEGGVVVSVEFDSGEDLEEGEEDEDAVPGRV